MGPIFSVTNMRPSGRKAIRQGSSKVAVVVMLKGSVASGFCSPTLTWAQAVAARIRSSAALADFIRILLVYLSQKAAQYSRRWSSQYYDCAPKRPGWSNRRQLTMGRRRSDKCRDGARGRLGQGEMD